MNHDPYERLPRVPVVFGRQDLVVQHAAGKKVLHLGCVDAGLMEERFARGELLHQKLAPAARELWGVDIDEEGIAFLKSKGFDRLLVADMARPHPLPELMGEEFDLIVACEVLEHLDNPGLFLETVRGMMIPGKTELIVSVPNAFRYVNWRWMLRGVEYVHPAHKYWFSYSTIRALLGGAKLQVKDLFVYTLRDYGVVPRSVRMAGEKSPGSRRRRSLWRRGFGYLRRLPNMILVRWLMRRTPFFGDGLLLICGIFPDERKSG